MTTTMTDVSTTAIYASPSGVEEVDASLLPRTSTFNAQMVRAVVSTMAEDMWVISTGYYQTRKIRGGYKLVLDRYGRPILADWHAGVSETGKEREDLSCTASRAIQEELGMSVGSGAVLSTRYVKGAGKTRGRTTVVQVVKGRELSPLRSKFRKPWSKDTWRKKAMVFPTFAADEVEELMMFMNSINFEFVDEADHIAYFVALPACVILDIMTEAGLKDEIKLPEPVKLLRPSSKAYRPPGARGGSRTKWPHRGTSSGNSKNKSNSGG